MQILVRNVEGVTTTVEVESSDITVGNLRAQLLEKHQGFLDSERGKPDVWLRFGAKIMDDDRITLATFNIQEGSILEEIMRVRGGADQFVKSNNNVQKRRGGAGYQRSSNNSNNQGHTIHRNKEKEVSERKMSVLVDCPKTDEYTSLIVERDNVTVNDIKVLVLRDQGVEIPKEETVLSWNQSILRYGNRRLRDYKFKNGWPGLTLDWEAPEGDDDDDEEEEEW